MGSYTQQPPAETGYDSGESLCTNIYALINGADALNADTTPVDIFEAVGTLTATEVELEADASITATGTVPDKYFRYGSNITAGGLKLVASGTENLHLGTTDVSFFAVLKYTGSTTSGNSFTLASNWYATSDGTAGPYQSSSSTVEDAAEHTVAFTWNNTSSSAGTLLVYVDGSDISSGGHSVSLANLKNFVFRYRPSLNLWEFFVQDPAASDSPGQLTIGDRFAQNNDTFVGDIKMAAFWSGRVLSGAEISSLHSNPWVLFAGGPVNNTLVITSVTPNTMYESLTGVVITGEGFQANQGNSKVYLSDVEQTVVSWSDTSITFNVVKPATWASPRILRVYIEY